jgi:hypothetical protein
MDCCGQRGQRDVGPPDPVEASGRLQRNAAQPHAEERADLVCEHHHAEQRGKMPHAEQPGDEPRRRRQRRHVGEADPYGEGEHGELGFRGCDECRDTDCAQRVEHAQGAGHRHAVYDGARDEAARDVAQPYHRQPLAGKRRRKTAQLDGAGHVRHEEGDVEAADEETGDDQPETGAA